MAKIKLQSLQEFLDKWSFLISKDDLSKLSVDYWENPVKRGETPCKQDLYYLYIELNMPIKLLEDYFKVSNVTIGTWNKKLGILKTKQQAYENAKIFNLRKYGVENTSSLPQIREKYKQTCLEKYGVDNASQSETTKQKFKQTMIEKYGVENPMHVQEFKDRLVETNMEKFGVPCCTQNEEIKKKLKQKVPDMLEKSKQTCLEKYGVEHSLQNEEVREKGKKTCLEKYGVEFATQSQQIQKKVFKTKQNNNSFATSKQEQMIYKLLLSKFSDVETQYRTDLYPFNCDFYIPELDLYVEYQGFWMHGKEPYNTENPEHQKLIKYWKSKSKQLNFKQDIKYAYKHAIEIWTKRDPMKRRIAKENNLNWIEFFTIEEFENWFSTIK